MTGLELRGLRKERGLSRQKFAELIKISIHTLDAWEGGKRNIPPLKADIIKVNLGIHEAFSTMIENAIDESALNESPTMYGVNANAQEVDFTEMSVMFVPLVSQYAQAGYLSGFADDEYIEELPRIPFANDIQNKGQYLCFEVKGDSMEDGSDESYIEGDILLCRNVRKEFWMSKLHINKWDFVIVHQEKGILVKRIVNHNVNQGLITLHSLNDYYDDFEVHLKDVAQIFNIVDFRRKKKRR